MNPADARVSRDEIVDYQTYSDERDAFREKMIEMKKDRRVHVGDALTFLFENHDTVRYQVQEMTRVEQIVREAEIQHELDTYNELLGGEGEIGCTLLIEIDDEGSRADKLRAWLKLPEHLYMIVDGGARVRARFDERQVGDDRLSSVQYIWFPVNGRAPTALGADHPELTVEAELSDAQKAALAHDLGL
jgi:hypothetical protein